MLQRIKIDHVYDFGPIWIQIILIKEHPNRNTLWTES